MVPWTSPMMTELPPLLSNMGHSVFPVSLSDTAWGCRHGHPAGPENWGLLPLRQDRLSSHSFTSTWVPRLSHRSLSQPPWREAVLLPARIAVRCLLGGGAVSTERGGGSGLCLCVGGGCGCAVGHLADVPVKTCCSVAEKVVRWKYGGKYDPTETRLKAFCFLKLEK